MLSCSGEFEPRVGRIPPVCSRLNTSCLHTRLFREVVRLGLYFSLSLLPSQIYLCLTDGCAIFRAAIKVSTAQKTFMEDFLCINTLNHRRTHSLSLPRLIRSWKKMQYDKNTMRRVCVVMDDGRIKLCCWLIAAKLKEFYMNIHSAVHRRPHSHVYEDRDLFFGHSVLVCWHCLRR